MRKDKFEELPIYLQNYIVDVENGTIFNKNSKRRLKSVKWDYQIVKLSNKGKSANYTLATVVAYVAGILNESNFACKITYLDNNTSNCKTDNLTLMKQEKKRKKVLSFYEKECIFRYCKGRKVSDVAKKFNIAETTVRRIRDLKVFKLNNIVRISNYIDKNLSETDKNVILNLKAPIEDIVNFYKIPSTIVRGIKSGEMW